MFNIDEYIACSDSCKSFVARSNSSRLNSTQMCVHEKKKQLKSESAEK